MMNGAGSALRCVSGCLLTVLLSIVWGCTSREPAREASAVESPLKQSPPANIPKAESEPTAKDAQPEYVEGTGETVWADAFRGVLISGMDGGLYEPYLPTVIERVQQALKNRNLYAGPVHGVLDAPTQKAIFAFQQAVHGLQLCGVPTPRTRRMLEQGSHTDPAFRKPLRRSYG